MLAQEMVLRYIGFYVLRIKQFIEVPYRLNMDEYLDDVSIALNECKNIPFDEIKQDFLDSMNKARIMFGNQAFRKISLDAEGNMQSSRNPINKSLFVTFSIALKDYSLNDIKKRGNVAMEFSKFLQSDAEFYTLISHNTNHQLKNAIEKVGIFLQRLYKKEV